MWTWLKCYLSGHHEYGVWCEPGAMFLRCVHCGHRSSGWSVEGRTVAAAEPSTRGRTERPLQVARAALRPVEDRTLQPAPAPSGANASSVEASGVERVVRRF